jgi:hypothetical protein
MQGWIEPFWLLAFCCVVYFTTISTSSIAGSDLLLRSKACPIAAGRRSFYSVVVFYFHGSTMGCFRRYIRFVGPKLYLVPALWDAFDVTLICFRRPKAIQCFLVRAPFENQFPVWMVMLVGCMSLFMVGVDRWFSAFLYSLAWSTNVSFFRLYHPRLVSFCCFWEVDFVRGISFAHACSQRKRLVQTGM